MTRAQRVVDAVVALVLYGCGHAHAPSSSSSPKLDALSALAPCVPEIRSAHLAVTGSVGAYQVGVLAVAVSPDHATIATARADGVLQISDVGSQTVRCIAGAYAVALSSDAHWAVGLPMAGPEWDEWFEDSQRGLTLWDLEQGKQTASVDVETPMYPAAAVSPKGTVVVAGAQDSRTNILLWDRGTLGHLDGGWFGRRAFSPDGTRLVTASNERPPELYAAPDWQPVGTVARPPSSSATKYDRPNAIALGSSVVAFAGLLDSGNAIDVWRPGDTNARFTLPPPHEFEMAEHFHRFSFTAIALSPTEDVLAVLIRGDDEVRRYDARTGKPLASFALINSLPAALAYSADESWLVVADELGRLEIFDAHSGLEIARSPGPPASAPHEYRDSDRSRVLSPDGKRIAAAYDEGNPSRTGIRLWDVATGKLLRDVPAGDDVFVKNVAFSPNGRWLVSVEKGTMTSRFGTVRLWDGVTGDIVDALSLDELRSSPHRVDFIGDHALTVTTSAGVLKVEIND